jgi:hypothetical protein
VAVKALRVLGDVRTRHVAVTARGGYEYRLITDRGENLLTPGGTPREHRQLSPAPRGSPRADVHLAGAGSSAYSNSELISPIATA